MSAIRELVTGFPWGLILISDAESTEPIPPWRSDNHPVASAESAVVLRVLHRDDGDVSVRIITSESEARSSEIFDGVLSIGSGLVRVSDALGNEAIECPLSCGKHRLRLYSDDRFEGAIVDVLLD
ncbi:hypothetical protein [Microbacterium sp.]|uniref:hypothetical protein n=1 Tax=Microbacterium sp. TaxID=51671 RepID=UPI0035B28A73